MASLVQQPESISFLGNLKAYRISSLDTISFKLTRQDVTIIEETYSPDGEDMITIDVKDVVRQYAKVSLPSSNTFNQSVEEFSAYLDDVFVGSFKVIPGGVRKLSDTVVNFLKGNWLTWQPRNKRVRLNQPEKLTYYHAVAGTVKVKFYLAAGGTETVTYASGSAGQYRTYNMEPEHLLSLSSHEGADLGDTVDVWVEDGSGNRLSYVQRYVITPETRDENYYLCVNSLGGIDTFCFTGTRSMAPGITHESGEIGDGLVDIKTAPVRSWTQNTGYMGATELAWLWDFYMSADQWAIIEGDINEIVLDSSGINIPEDENVTSCDFSYRLSEDGTQQNASRSREVFRTVKLMSPSGQQVVLTPRLADYPMASISDSLLFLAQSPYVQEWKQLSLGAIREWIKTVLPIVTVIDSLTSDRRDLALSAYQGKALKALIDAKVIEAGGVPFDAEPTEDSENAVFSGGVFSAIAAAVNRGYVFAGIAHQDDPVFTPVEKTFFVASEAGTYTNFGDLTVAEGELAFLYYDTEWHQGVIADIGHPVDVADSVNDADLDVADEDGNVLARFKGGHFRTKYFDSAKNNANMGIDSVDEFSEEDDYALGSIVKRDGLLYKFVTGHEAGEWDEDEAEQINIIAGNLTPVDVADSVNDADLDISDENGNVIMRLENGHIKTKYFDSESGGFLPYSANPIRFQIPVNCVIPNTTDNTVTLQDSESEYNDWGVLLLPEAYTPTGKPTRLLIFCHGAGGSVSGNQSQVENSTIVKYFVANGFAVMDMNGLPEAYATAQGIDIMNNIGSPFAVSSYIKGYEYVTRNYNIIKDGCFIGGASMGGISSTNVVLSKSLPIIAHIAMCPVLDTYNQIWLHPWSSGAPKVAMQKIYGLSTEYDETKVCGFNPIVNGMQSYDTDGNRIPSTGGYPDNTVTEYKSYPCPLKIWHCDNDGTVSQLASIRHITAIRNAGGQAWLRKFLTGGHEPMDVGNPIANPSGNTTYKGATLQIRPAIEEAFLFIKRYNY